MVMVGIEANLEVAETSAKLKIANNNATTTPTLIYPAFSYENYTADDSSPVTVHLCEDLPSFTAAAEYLKGEKYMGIDIEHEPIGRERKSKPKQEKPAAAKQLDIDIRDVGDQVLSDYLAANPDAKVQPKKNKEGIPLGLQLADGTYYRLTRHTMTKLSVLQLASDSHIVVAYFAAFPTTSEITDPAEFIPPALKVILDNENDLKLGVSISGDDSDMRNCSRYFGMPSNGLLEPDNVVQSRGGNDLNMTSLKYLSEIYLEHMLIGKGCGNIATSEWQLPQRLSAEQIAYAANDAFVAIKIYDAVMGKVRARDPQPAFPALRNEEPFEWGAWRDMRIAKCQASGTKFAKRKLRNLGVIREPPPALVIPEGMHKSDVQGQKRRKCMLREDAEVAAALATLRDRLLNELDVRPGTERKKQWVLEDKFIDQIAKTKPRPRTEGELKAMVSASARRMFGNFVGEFLEVLLEHVAKEPEDKGGPADAAKGQQEESNSSA